MNSFQQVSDTVLDEHANRGRPALVVFSSNSNSKTSFLQHFLGIDNILPSSNGSVTARIVQFTCASAEQTCFRVYETIEKTSIQYEGDLSKFFEDQLQPNWEGITNTILPHVKRPINMDENSSEFNEWTKSLVEVSLSSNVLSLGIDVYDTPDFLSDNREEVLTDNLHKLVKRIKPTLVFLYDNATMSDTDKSCCLAMRNALGSIEPDAADECTCFDVCAIPYGSDQWAEAYSMPSLTLARGMLAAVDNYFDLLVSTTFRAPEQWKILLEEATEWGSKFFDEYEKLLPKLVDDLMTNIFELLDELKLQITHQAALIIRTDDPVDALLQHSTKTIQDYIRLTVQEQVIKVAANNVITTRRDQVRALVENHFQQQHGLHKNELLSINQRGVLSEISMEVLQQTSLFNVFLHNLTKIPRKFTRFWRGLPTRLSANYRDRYNRIVNRRIRRGKDNVYQLLDAMDACSTLSNEINRRIFADYCLTKIAKELEEQRNRFGHNLVTWIEKQKKSFDTKLSLNFIYVTQHLTDRQTFYNVISEFSGPFARLECQLLAAIEITKRGGVLPIIGEELGRGGFCSVHTAQWGVETNLAVKKLLRPSIKNEQMIALEAHYHRKVTLLCLEHIAPLLHVYENPINDNQRELWLIMPRYPMSLRKYLIEHIHEISFDRAISFAITIATALAGLHRLEIVHGDIRASNVMLDDNEQCYIIDFGTASFGLSNRKVLSTGPLRPKMTDAHYDGAAADVYSFGLLLYEILPKASYEYLDTNVLSRLEELFRLIPPSDAIRKGYENQIRACLDPIPANRPRADKLVCNLKLIQQRTETELCIICETRHRTLRLIPCRHKVICVPCWETWSRVPDVNTRCILCKAIVTKQIQDIYAM